MADPTGHACSRALRATCLACLLPCVPKCLACPRTLHALRDLQSPMTTKLGRAVTLDKMPQPSKSFNPLITWSRNKLKALYFHFHKFCDP